LDGCGIRVMSVNVRGSSRDRGETNAWENRADVNVEIIGRRAPDLIGFQELQIGNLETYRERLPHYAHVLGPRYGNRPPYDFNAIFFDSRRLELLGSGGFWLSETPGRYSASWGTRVVRSASWAHFRLSETNLSLLHLNTHLDHVSRLARVEGARLVLRRVSELLRYEPPVILTGDFNCRPGTPVYRHLVNGGFVDTYLAAGNEDGRDSNTFHAFKGAHYRETRPGLGPRRIDWILLRDPRRRVRAASHSIVRDYDERSGIYPSDHYPVLAELVGEQEEGPESSGPS
jgi:endonuclease/exonuclease/phosphatase family metal-dependent hydrolase